MKCLNTKWVNKVENNKCDRKIWHQFHGTKKYRIGHCDQFVRKQFLSGVINHNYTTWKMLHNPIPQMQKIGNTIKHVVSFFSRMNYLLQVEFEVALVFEFNFTVCFPIGIIFIVWLHRIPLRNYHTSTPIAQAYDCL